KTPGGVSCLILGLVAFCFCSQNLFAADECHINPNRPCSDPNKHCEGFCNGNNCQYKCVPNQLECNKFFVAWEGPDPYDDSTYYYDVTYDDQTPSLIQKCAANPQKYVTGIATWVSNNWDISRCYCTNDEIFQPYNGSVHCDAVWETNANAHSFAYRFDLTKQTNAVIYYRYFGGYPYYKCVSCSPGYKPVPRGDTDILCGYGYSGNQVVCQCDQVSQDKCSFGCDIEYPSYSGTVPGMCNIDVGGNSGFERGTNGECSVSGVSYTDSTGTFTLGPNICEQ
ncbi:MAG: hypothetical protein IJR92_01805, partial [Alphaproteobacteria bacterium]|nr:hypothetical protein [Alphaproteobacteria bacterium]